VHARVHASPTSAPSAKPAATSTPVVRAPKAPPRILAVDIDSTVHGGQRITGRVKTTSNVASVEVRVATYGIVMQKTGVGTFTVDYAFGGVPFFLRGTYTMHVIARNAAGDRDERELPLTIQ
jgi:hypothetical protein